MLKNIVAAVLLISSPQTVSAGAQPAAPMQSPGEVVQFKINLVPNADRRPVAFEIINNVPVFRAKIGGNPVWAVLDNGMGISLIDVNFARSHGLAIGRLVSPLTTATGSVQRWRLDGVSVEIPGQMSMTSAFSAVDLSFVERAVGRPVSLVIGKEYFDNLAVLVRSSDQTLQFGPSGSLRASPKTPLIELRNGSQVQVDVGGRPLLLSIDLGSNNQIVLSESAWSSLGVESAPTTNGKAANLQGEVFGAKQSTLPHVRLGSVVASDVRVSIEPVLAHDADGLLGFGFLDHLDFALDSKAGKLWLIPPRNGEDQAAAKH